MCLGLFEGRMQASCPLPRYSSQLRALPRKQAGRTRLIPHSRSSSLRLRAFNGPSPDLPTSPSSRAQLGRSDDSAEKDLLVTRAAASADAPTVRPPMQSTAPSDRHPSSGRWQDHVRAALFFAWTFAVAAPVVFTMFLTSPLVLQTDRYRRLSQHALNNLWAKISTMPFYEVQVLGRENLPPPEKAVVYVANHQSFLDIYSLFHLERPFKFISKASVFYIPIIGWSMFLTGHVRLSRMDRRSQLDCLKQCGDLLGHGAPVLFFPEGARSKDGVMVGFKKGAFSVAVKAGVDIVPVTVLGTGKLMQAGEESKLCTGKVQVIVHPSISTQGRTADQVCAEARDAIAAAMPPELVGSATKMAPDHES